MTFGVLGEPSTLDPYDELASDLTYQLIAPLYPSLFRLQPDGSAVPYLASDLQEIPGGVRVSLAEMSWSDGRPITAKDVVATWKRAGRASGLALVRRARVSGDAVEFEGRVGDWATALAVRSPILPGGKAKASVFGGPFVLADRVPGLKVVYEPNPRWSGEGPLLDRITVFHIDSSDIMLALLDEGRLDAAAVPSSVNLGERLDEMGLSYERALGWESIRLDVSGLNGPGSLGLTQALDLKALAAGLIRSDGEVIDAGVQPEGSPPTHVSIGYPEGDELLYLLQRAMQIQLADRGIATEILGAPVRTIYGPWAFDAPVEVRLLRVVGDPLGEAFATGLFRVRTYVAHQGRVEGLEVHPGPDGPLWNAHAWSIDE